MSGWFWFIVVVYILLLAGVGVQAWLSSRSAEDYIMAGSKIGFFVGLLTFAASLFSAFTLVGMPDYFRTKGVGGWMFLALPDAAMFLLILWFGLHLRRVAKRENYQGMAGLLSSRYGGAFAGVVYLLGIFVFLIPYVAVQIRGMTTFLDDVSSHAMPPWFWPALLAGVLIIYCEAGGLRSIVRCDVVQGTVLLIAIWIVAVRCVGQLGGVAGMFEQVRAANPALLSTPGPTSLITPQYLIASFFAILFLPVTQPQLTTRLVILKNDRTLGALAVGMGFFAALVIIPTIAIGMYGAVRHSKESADEFITNVVLHEQSPLVAALGLVGLIAAAASTAGAMLFALGTELRSMPQLRLKSPIFFTRVCITVFSAAAFALSVSGSKELVAIARTSFAGTALTAPMILAAVLCKRRPGLEIPLATAVALALFLAAQFPATGVPMEFGAWRLDLTLLGAVGAVGLVSCAARRGEHGLTRTVTDGNGRH